MPNVELVPYHTKSYTDETRTKFGVVEDVKPIVEKAIKRDAVILCPYYGAVNMWLNAVEKLGEYQFFYTTDETNIVRPPGSLNINKLRHYRKVLAREPREKDENCEPLFDQLVKLGWTRNKQ